MEYVNPYDQLIVKRMFQDGYTVADVIAYLRKKYGHVNRRFVDYLRHQVNDAKRR